jgi:hypothetical protein
LYSYEGWRPEYIIYRRGEYIKNPQKKNTIIENPITHLIPPQTLGGSRTLSFER